MLPKKEETQISYSVEKILTKSTRSIVYMATDKRNNKYVIKKIPFEYRNEVEVWEQLSDKQYFVKLITTFTNEHENSISLIFEYYPCTLQSTLTMNHQEFKRYTQQLLLSVQSLHNQGYVHCNITPENCLIRDEDLKLYDFSMTQRINEQGTFEIISNYSPPEIILGNYSIKQSIDIWAVGCVISEVILGSPLFKGNKREDIFLSIIRILGTPTGDQIKEITNSRITEVDLIQVQSRPLIELFQLNTDYYLLDLISRMLQYRPSDRISVEDALKHPFFQSDPLPNLPRYSQIFKTIDNKELLNFEEYGTFKQMRD